jgi:hypothetical protein
MTKKPSDEKKPRTFEATLGASQGMQLEPADQASSQKRRGKGLSFSERFSRDVVDRVVERIKEL